MISEWPHTHKWDVTPKEAIEIQKSLVEKLKIYDDFESLSTVAGVDVGFKDDGKITRAAVAVLSFPQLKVVEQIVIDKPTSFPYVPGLLSFRELPAVLEALRQLNDLPDMILCDGQGYAHPRHMGIACHLGIVTNIPTIGVGKTRLIGTYVEPADKKGAWSPLSHKEEIIGAVLRSREHVKPIYISAGHRVSLESAIDIVMRCITKYKLPETTRQAHHLASNA